MSETTKTSESLLREILGAIQSGNEERRRLTRAATTIRGDVSAIREGRTGADARTREDPLSTSERAQVDEVKTRYYERRKANPRYSLLSVSKEVFKEWQSRCEYGGYDSFAALNTRAWKEIQREDKGLAPF